MILGSRSKDHVDRHIGHRLRTRRLALRMSQTDLADAIGVSFQQVQKYEKGSSRVSASTLQALAEMLKVPIGYFFAGLPLGAVQGNGADMDWAEFLAMPDGLALFKAFRNIESEQVRRAVIDLLGRLGTRH
jgi:transcriptional regulator with XRE-family HTH domain